MRHAVHTLAPVSTQHNRSRPPPAATALSAGRSPIWDHRGGRPTDRPSERATDATTGATTMPPQKSRITGKQQQSGHGAPELRPIWHPLSRMSENERGCIHQQNPATMILQRHKSNPMSSSNPPCFGGSNKGAVGWEPSTPFPKVAAAVSDVV